MDERYYENPEFWQWVEAHITDDPSALRLKWHGKMPWVNQAIMQIECRNKAAKKLHEELSYPTFYFPTALSAEQCTGDSLARFHTSLINEGDTVIDLTCGLGIDALHMAGKASSVTAIDVNKELTDALDHNAKAMGIKNIMAINADCCEWIKSCNARFDVAFIDPARRGDMGQRLFNLADCSPNVIAMLPELKNIANRLVVKASPMLDVTNTLRELPDSTDIYVTGTRTECKELLALADFHVSTVIPAIHAMTDGAGTYTFTLEDEAMATVTFGSPEMGDILYEPYPTVMKAGPFKLLSQQFGVTKFCANTHLYFSKELHEEFPGDKWRIDRVIEFSSREIKAFPRTYPQINVAVRNFGWSAEKLKAKLKTKDGGDLRMIAATAEGDRKLMLILSKA